MDGFRVPALHLGIYCRRDKDPPTANEIRGGLLGAAARWSGRILQFPLRTRSGRRTAICRAERFTMSAPSPWAIIAASALFAAPPAGAATKTGCLTDAVIDRAVGDQVRAKVFAINSGGLPDLPLCSGLTLAQQIQRMRLAAFPEEAEQQPPPPDPPQIVPVPQESAEETRSVIKFIPIPLAARPAPRRAAPRSAARRAAGASFYPNCRAARAAGAAPVRRGEPGYSRRLDRDGDGIACE